MAHQKKGGIHEYRSFMGASGWYRLTGAVHQNICPAKDAGGPFRNRNGFFVLRINKKCLVAGWCQIPAANVQLLLQTDVCCQTLSPKTFAFGERVLLALYGCLLEVLEVKGIP